jgi:thymidylate kinase
MNGVDWGESSYVIVFLGPDGAGKSTVISLVEDGLRSQRASFVRCYFAPGFFRRYRQKSAASVTIAPHEGRQYGWLLAGAKISLLLLEFILGVWSLRRNGGGVVLFDRYILDLLVDPIRYRLSRVGGWMRVVLLLAPKPDLLVVISAPAEMIQARKREVPIEETMRQLTEYKMLANKFKNSMVVENVTDPSDAADAVLSRLMQK